MNVEEMVRKTKENPFWIHFRAGNLFRAAFHANVVQNLLNTGTLDKGLVVAEAIWERWRPSCTQDICPGKNRLPW